MKYMNKSFNVVMKMLYKTCYKLCEMSKMAYIFGTYIFKSFIEHDSSMYVYSIVSMAHVWFYFVDTVTKICSEGIWGIFFTL